jgi:hypothetical protein
MYNKEWKSESRELNSLIASEYNPRRLTKAQADQLKRSIAKFGLCEPIVIQPNGSIIGGHQRAKILKSLGHTTVNVYVPTEALSPEEANELNIRLNKNTGEWDYDVLANMVDPDELMDFGFTPKELDLEVFPEEVVNKDFDESLTDNLEIMALFSIKIPISNALKFEEELNGLLLKYPKAKKTKKI